MTTAADQPSLTDLLHRVLQSRELGARLTPVLTDDADLHSRWGRVMGPGSAEVALLPLSLAMPGLELMVADALQTAPQQAFLRGQVTGRVTVAGILGAATGAEVTLPFQAEARLTDGRIAALALVCNSSPLQMAEPGLIPLPPLSAAPQSGNTPWARAWTDLVTQAAQDRLQTDQYDPALTLDWPGGLPEHGPEALVLRWQGLRDALPSARFEVISGGAAQPSLSRPRAVLRWRLTGVHDGWGAFGAPSGADLVVDGFSMAEFGANGVLRDWTIYDPAAIRDQIAAQTPKE